MTDNPKITYVRIDDGSQTPDYVDLLNAMMEHIGAKVKFSYEKCFVYDNMLNHGKILAKDYRLFAENME